MRQRQKTAYRLACACLALVAAAQPPSSADPVGATDLLALAQAWDQARYAVEDEHIQYLEFTRLAGVAESLSGHAAAADVMTWKAVIAASRAGVTEPFEALQLAQTARQLLEGALQLHPDIGTQRLIYATLAELYAGAPGFPISFGDARRADELFRKSLALGGDDSEVNLYYGEFLTQAHRDSEAVDALNRAINAPPRPDRAVGDAGVRAEARRLLIEVQRHIEPRRSR